MLDPINLHILGSHNEFFSNKTFKHKHKNIYSNDQVHCKLLHLGKLKN